MSKTKRGLIAAAVTVLMFALVVGFDQRQPQQQWEYKVVLFSRDAKQAGMEKWLKMLGDAGWEYAGPLANNGMNAQYVAFKKPR